MTFASMLPERNMRTGYIGTVSAGKLICSQDAKGVGYSSSTYLVTLPSIETIFCFFKPKSRTHGLTSTGIFREDR